LFLMGLNNVAHCAGLIADRHEPDRVYPKSSTPASGAHRAHKHASRDRDRDRDVA
jgi:hypothetical protein